MSRLKFGLSVFDNPVVLGEMLELRRQGISSKVLGRLYHKDHSTILYHCKRNRVYPPKPEKLPELAREDIYIDPIDEATAHPMQYEEIIELSRRPAKSYKEYQREDWDRSAETRSYFRQYGVLTYTKLRKVYRK